MFLLYFNGDESMKCAIAKLASIVSTMLFSDEPCIGTSVNRQLNI